MFFKIVQFFQMSFYKQSQNIDEVKAAANAD